MERKGVVLWSHISFTYYVTEKSNLIKCYYFQLGDDLRLADGIAVEFESGCKTAAKVTAKYNSTTGDVVEESAEILKEVAAVVCPNQCSGNGVCMNGTCSCTAGKFVLFRRSSGRKRGLRSPTV